MSNRALLFLLSLVMLIGALSVDGWLIATNQVRSVDGLFTFFCSSVIACAFGLYLRWMIRSVVSGAETNRVRAEVKQGKAAPQREPVVADRMSDPSLAIHS